jgi:hypothetical protein
VAYDEGLADRVRSIFRARGAAFQKSVLEKRMFGGLVFMIHGNMCCGVRNRELMLRLGPEEADAALAQPDELVHFRSRAGNRFRSRFGRMGGDRREVRGEA